MTVTSTFWRVSVCLTVVLSFAVAAALAQTPRIGREVAIRAHLQDGDEFNIPLAQLIDYGRQLFTAKFTAQEGAGRPMTKGTGAPISDPSSPLLFPRNFDRVSSPEANACSGCHNAPVVGAGGDRVTEVFVLAQRFDHLTLDHSDGITLRGAVDESGKFVTMENATNDRKTIGMNGSGFLEMVARQMTADLQAIAAATPTGSSSHFVTKGVSFGILTHNADGTWNTSQVVGLPAPSLKTSGTTPPSLLILPYHQASAVVSLRQFTNNAMNHHHGMQSEERFGLGADPDGDGFTNELTVADLTAISLFQATLPVPGRVIPNDPAVERAVLLGERLFDQIGCNRCHMDALPLTAGNNPGLPGQPGWIYFEPNPYNPATGPNSPNLRLGPADYPHTAPALSVDLTSEQLPPPHLKPNAQGIVMVPAYTDLKLHDISATSDPKTDPECEPLDQNQSPGSPAFFAGNCLFLTRKLWGFYNQGGAFMHHGKFTTAREAVEAHSGEALAERQAFDALPADQRDAIIEFLKSLQVLQPGSRSLVLDENGHPRPWPPPSKTAGN
ncbi:MAG TPA: di-heme oxidoredictase family protein [Candidatus Acidoferrum sp.]|nr:di-heme oxidoredictase family protein [Candidatus Acidoferrum sp.]